MVKIRYNDTGEEGSGYEADAGSTGEAEVAEARNDPFESLAESVVLEDIGAYALLSDPDSSPA